MCGGVFSEETPDGFRRHGRFRGVGACLATVIGPGPQKGTERLYASHVYDGSALDVVAVDPVTGKTDVFTSPLLSESGAWAIALGPDGQIYVGTLPHAHIMRVDWQTKKLIDMGCPSSSELYIWQLALGSDKKLYGCTYPNAKLIRFDPATGKSEDIGRMSATENYARYIAADSKGFVYVGIGTAKRDLVAYEIATGKYRSILPQSMKGQGTITVAKGMDGNVYANEKDYSGRWLRLDGFTTIPVTRPAAAIITTPSLANGRRVDYDGHRVSIHNRGDQYIHVTTDYLGKPLSIFRIGLGPDDRLYGSTAQPGHFFWASPESDRWEEIANAGKGEIYSFLAWGDKLVTAAYSFPSPIMVYKPGQAWQPGIKPESNPRQIHYKGENGGWRPMAMISGPQKKIYIGAVSGYGLLGGGLSVLDPVTGQLNEYLHVVRDQSVTSLAVTAEGMIVGGTTIRGGGGSHPTQTAAKVFLWDPVQRKTVFEGVPVSGAGSIEAVCMGKRGLAYGFTDKKVMFVFDSLTRKVTAVKPSGIGHVIYNAIGRGVDGRLYGLHDKGIFTIDEKEHIVKEIVKYPPGITGGFAIRGKRIYFTSGPQIVSYGF